jgi:uncharacterized protein
MAAPRKHFALTLVVNHACNLRCTYCYTGAKINRPMSHRIGAAAIDRACRSLAPSGILDLGFFGGEPLLEASQVLKWMRYARQRAAALATRVRFTLTTNGTLDNPEAWRVMLDPDLELAISCDGPPAVHDQHRRDVHNRPTSAMVETTLRKLLSLGRSFRVVAVIRPDNLEHIPNSLEYLYALGIRHVDLSLDLWTRWTADDGRRLNLAVVAAANLWRRWLPDFSLNWFDVKAAALAHLPSTEEGTHCGFGVGEIAVAPSGRLYPCERVIGEDQPGHPLCLPGHATDPGDFLQFITGVFARCSPCAQCALASACDTTCRCSNFIRTGDLNRPDGLLCILNKAAARATSAVLAGETSNKRETCYV